MLEKPDLPDEEIIACLQAAFGLRPPVQIAFLPLGADVNTAVYRIVSDDGRLYFGKLRRGVFDETAVRLPKYLREQGIEQIIAPLATQTGQLWASLDGFNLILYPFIEGRNGYQVELSDKHWVDLGKALKHLHNVTIPAGLKKNIQKETFTPQWRQSLSEYMGRVEREPFDEPVARKLAAFLNKRRAQVHDLVRRAEQLAQALQNRPPELVLCHSDVHAGNILIDAGDSLYIVDWDEPICAPKERDLMYVGGGQGFSGHTAKEEETLFYRGYGPTQIDPSALAYYRYERIVQDIESFCEQIFTTDGGGEDREQAYEYLRSNFIPGGTLEIAHRSDPRVGAELCDPEDGR